MEGGAKRVRNYLLKADTCGFALFPSRQTCLADSIEAIYLNFWSLKLVNVHALIKGL